MVSKRQIRVPELLAVKIVRQISLNNRLAHQSTTHTNKRRQWRARAGHSRRKSGPLLMRGLGIHKDIPVSDTKLTLGLRVGFLSSHLTADILFPVIPKVITGAPKMSLLLEAKSMPALIIKPSLILVVHTDDLGWYITSYQQGQMLVQNLTGLSADQMLR